MKEPDWVREIQDESDREAVRAVLRRRRWAQQHDRGSGDGPPLGGWNSPGPHYLLCTNDSCPVAYAFRDEEHQAHWHFIGSDVHPAWEVP